MTVDTMLSQQGSADAAAGTGYDDPRPVVGAAGGSSADAEAGDATPRRRGRPKGSGARRVRTVELTLTVSGTADGEWQAELKHGDTWLARGLAVSAAAVSRAAKELHDDLSKPIDEVINAAVDQQKARVAALEAELEQARKALAELAD